MAQQIILAAQSVPKFQSTRRCNNYAVLQSISCSPECKIMEQILLDHPLSYALTATADVPVVYLQQFWKTVSKVPDTKDTIRGLAIKQSTTPLPPLGDDRERDEMAEATLLSLTLYKTALAVEAQKNIAKVEEKLDEEEIEKMVEDEEDEELYASEFVDFIDKEKKDDNKEDKKDDDVEKMDEVVEEKDNDDHTDHTLARSHATGSMETRNEQMQTPISIPTRSPRKDLSSDKTIYEELTAIVSPTTATTSKDSSKLKIKRGFNSNKTKILPGSIAGMCRRRGQIRT
ncbi:hypothetical protein Tco_0685030, partial [Tanacetum coccineum]